MTMTETILANARIITDDDDFIGHIRFNEDGIIDLGKGADVPAGGGESPTILVPFPPLFFLILKDFNITG